MQVASVHVYPVKSCRALDVAGSAVERWGLRHDRRWMVTEPDGRRVTAREQPRLLAMTATPDGSGNLVLSAPEQPALGVAVPADGPVVPVGISRLSRARSAGTAADGWVSALLHTPAHLVWLDDPVRRTVAPIHGGLDGDPLSLADAGPLLLTTEASLERLREWLAEAPGRDPGSAPLSMARFRPNVVVAGDLEPFVEDTWTRVRIGALEYRFAEQCDRCVMTTYDPDSLARGHEPLRTLAKHRRRDGKVWFGIRLIPVAEGRVDVGDPVEAR